MKTETMCWLEADSCTDFLKRTYELSEGNETARRVWWETYNYLMDFVVYNSICVLMAQEKESPETLETVLTPRFLEDSKTKLQNRFWTEMNPDVRYH